MEFLIFFLKLLDSIAESQICLSNKDDKADSSGRFFLISCWNLIRIKLMPKTWSDVIWKAAVPPKRTFFMWKLFHDAIPIDSKISQCGVQLASSMICWFFSIWLEALSYLLCGTAILDSTDLIEQPIATTSYCTQIGCSIIGCCCSC